MDHLGHAGVTHDEPAVAAAVEVGGMVADLRASLADLLHSDRFEAQHLADMQAHKALVRRLGDAYPGIPVVSEEDGVHDTIRPSDYFLIDPIDGTASWAGGYPGFVCQIARIRDGIPVFGVIHAPVLGRTWVAKLGAGASLNGVSVPPLGDERSRPTVVVDNYPVARGVSADLMAWLGECNYVESGSIGLKAALVASGEADLFVKDVVVRDWDVAPAMVLIGEVNGFLTNPDGTPFTLAGPYEKPRGLLVARSRILGEDVAAWLASRT